MKKTMLIFAGLLMATLVSTGCPQKTNDEKVTQTDGLTEADPVMNGKNHDEPTFNIGVDSPGFNFGGLTTEDTDVALPKIEPPTPALAPVEESEPAKPFGGAVLVIQEEAEIKSAEQSAPAPAEETQPAEQPAPAPVEETQPAEQPAPTPVEETQPTEQPAPTPVEEAQPTEQPAPDPTSETNNQGTKMSITKADFGVLPETDQKVDIYTLTNANGASMQVISLGGIIYTLNLPDKDGNFGNVSANLQTVEEYMTVSPNFGTLVGRYGNRIGGAKYSIGDQVIDQTAHANDNGNLLHGGKNGFHKAVWTVEELQGDDFVGLTLKLTSNENHQGFPGTVNIVVAYKLNNNNELTIDYSATTDKATPINLTQHTYFNLSAFQTSTILDEIAQINANQFIPVDAKLIPTGEIANVEGTPMDFRTPTAIGERVEQVGDNPKGYDHCYVLNKNAENELSLAAKVVDPTSGRTMEVWTTEPGVQFYTGNFLDGKLKSGDLTYVKNAAFCLETQHYPDSPNKPNFPNTILKPDETYHTVTVFKFGVQK
ncbi:MAG: galactose-1-epimerase [Planctomycetaceae bacterium]|jgi:aldose 1-epimerase|nr:galactose-1-epimerase [Planctomycetaceae bacterium]